MFHFDLKVEILLRIYTKRYKIRYIAPIYIKINRLNVHCHWFTTSFTEILEIFTKIIPIFKPVSETIDITDL